MTFTRESEDSSFVLEFIALAGHSVSFYGNIDHFDAVKVHWVGEIYPTRRTGCFFGSFLYIRVLIFRYIYIVMFSYEQKI